MPNERIAQALTRIDAALGRMEAHGVAPGAADHDGRDPGQAELAARHARLRAGTVEALARLDGLIEAAAGEGAR